MYQPKVTLNAKKLRKLCLFLIGNVSTFGLVSNHPFVECLFLIGNVSTKMKKDNIALSMVALGVYSL